MTGVLILPIPKHWQVEPNRKDKLLGIFADTPLKKQRKDRGEMYFPYMESLESGDRH